MNSIIEIKHLKKHFGSLEVLNDIDFHCDKGEVITIIGSSGSGKSTLLRCINLLETPDAGEILYHDKDILKGEININEHRTHVGMVFQSFNLFNNKSVLENCMLGQIKVLKRSKADAKEKAMLFLKKVGMESFANASAMQLSGGQKQRVGIARALLQNPKIMLCDEPIASLDPQSSKVIMEHLKAITTNMRIPCIVNLHQVDVALHYSDRIIGMHQGSIVFNGKPQELGSDVIEKIYGVPMNELISKVEEVKA